MGKIAIRYIIAEALFPRVSGDIENYGNNGNNGKGPVWWYPMEKMYSEDNRPSERELEEIKAKLQKELEYREQK